MNPNEEISELIRSQQELILRQQQLNEAQTKSIEELTAQNQELLSQMAWLKRQLFGRRSEKLALLDLNQPSLFEDPIAAKQQQIELEEARGVAIQKIEKLGPDKKTERHNRKLLEGLPVVEVRIEPEGVDHDRYKCIGEERTRTLEFEPGKLYVKEIVRPKYGLKDNTQLPEEGESAVVIAPLPLLPIHKELGRVSIKSYIRFPICFALYCIKFSHQWNPIASKISIV